MTVRPAGIGFAIGSLVGWLMVTAGPARAEDAPVFGSAFWQHWGDGRAEVSAYQLDYSRYGELRRGTAVAIFVTEPFAASRRVKSDLTAGDGVFQVLKLNLIQDFPTGLYDYNLMTSTFLALEPRPGGAPGRLAKVSFSGGLLEPVVGSGGAGPREARPEPVSAVNSLTRKDLPIRNP